ncbi:Glutaredoxin-like domain [Hydrocarboniphaga daqingensis]|jgi:hypothetical protein|uniref:Glutaredoxin-like domain n=1 Tax=Hydrocarboniphaga daqingensis TaxID=490188 RepID=A0A1M5KIS8_9GAMM|nr:glutaredoxin family protein [Hydrocarboniphaga daqingensis]SHG52784.1 Glutaredoxin-like domain [Hydrocarboniphaga daqingensis]
MSAPGLLLLSRSGCHLCEQLVVDLLDRWPDLVGCLAEADVDSRDDWQRRYGLKIPVLLDAQDGTAVCVSQLDPDAIADWRRARGC